jgi:hypothetical protein
MALERTGKKRQGRPERDHRKAQGAMRLPR